MAEVPKTRYRRRTRVLHWLHTAAFLVLLATGLAGFLQHEPSHIYYPLTLLHRAAAVVFAAVPLIYLLIWPAEVAEFIRGLFQWQRSDFSWLRKAARCYFGSRTALPPLGGRLNPVKRGFEVIMVFTGLIAILTGLPLWFFKYLLSLATYQWLLTIHTAAFIAVFLIFLLHFYLETIHPRFNKSLRAMLGKRNTVKKK